jgi:hypothetical protein
MLRHYGDGRRKVTRTHGICKACAAALRRDIDSHGFDCACNDCLENRHWGKADCRYDRLIDDHLAKEK